MLPPPPLNLAYQDVDETLHEWINATKRFGSKKSWPVGFYSPDYIFRRLEESAKAIVAPVRIIAFNVKFEKENSERLVLAMVSSIQYHSGRMIEALEDGTDVMLDHSPKVKVLEAWQDVCRSVYSFARSAAGELKDLQPEYPGVFDESLSHASGSLEVLKSIAEKCRSRLNRGYLEDWINAKDKNS
jgi:hypothetical protein